MPNNDNRRPFADTVNLRVGARVLWDDRRGWEGRVVGLPTPETLDVDYDNGEQDRDIRREMFTIAHL